MIRLDERPGLQVLSCDAMNTTYTLRLDCTDSARARDAAGACFNQLEELEAQLSRFRHDSDVSRLNQMQEGDILYIAESTYSCLLHAAAARVETGGLFDVALRGERGQLELAPDCPRVRCLKPGRQIDLGGIGKGFALDQLVGVLSSYQIDSGLISAGASTLLALGPDVWPIALTGDGHTEPFGLQKKALSASGTGVQGAHVTHPEHPDQASYTFQRVWVATPTAALADAYSTACLLMDETEIRRFRQAQGETATIFAERPDSSGIESIGGLC